MAKTQFTTIGGGLVGADKANLRRYRAFDQSSVAKRRIKYTREEKKNLPSFSLLPQISDAWNLLSSPVKIDWDNAGAVIGLSGYRLFVQDKSYRLMNSLAGNATPSTIHQYLVGKLTIPEGAGDTKFQQSGNDIFTFPATLFLSAKTDLLSDPANGEYVKVSFVYAYDDGGGPMEESKVIDLPLSSGWTDYSEVLTLKTGLLGPWSLEIETHAVKGVLLFDNLYVVSAGGVITNDGSCKRVSKRWQLLLSPAGVSILSVYPT
jgi:hypothetical protein